MTQPAPATAAPRRFQLPNLSTLGPLIALLIAVIVFSTQSPRFLSGTNFSLILQQISYTAVLAIGQTLIILIAGIDLSIGIVMALGGLVMAKLATQSGVSPVLAILAGFATTMFFGFLNSQIITRLRVPPFIATLGMLGIVTALNQTYSGSQTISNLPPALTALGNTFKVGGTAITYGTVLMLLLYLIAWFVLSETAPGRHVYAVGNNPEAARLSGIPIDRLTVIVYTVAGLIYGVAAPGYDALTMTSGGEISGNCDVGSCRMASPPMSRMTTEITIANTGLRMNLLNIFWLVICERGRL